jgi:hypothetical protein
MSASISMGPCQPNNANYYDPDAYILENAYAKKEQRFFAEDWRQGFEKHGKLIGLPVIRVLHPQNLGQFYLIRPYYIQNSDQSLKTYETGQKIIAFASPLFDMVVFQEMMRKEGQLKAGEKLIEVHPSAFHEDASQPDASAAKQSENPAQTDSSKATPDFSKETMQMFAAAMKKQQGL